MSIFRHYCEFHLGDCLIHLHFLRHLALKHTEHEFQMAVHSCHREQLAESITDCPNVQLVNLEGLDISSWRNVWKNAGEFWARHQQRADYARFYLDWFRTLAREMKLESPFSQPIDLLFSYPALEPFDGRAVWQDFMVCNSPPCSGQLKSYNGPTYFLPLIERIYRAQKTCIITDPIPDWLGPCTRENHLSISHIGRMSIACKAIVGICNGPMWPCLNIWSIDKPVFIIQDHVLGDEFVTGLKPNMVQVKTMDQLISALEEKNLL